MGTRTDIHDRALKAETTDELMGLYQDWAASYDQDLIEDWGYQAPERVAQLVKTAYRDKGAKILDAGCGTGLVGQELAKSGFKTIDGADYSQSMLDEAKNKGVYSDLYQIDLNLPLSVKDGTYDIVTCAGTFTASHIHPEAIKELVRITRKGGIVCVTVRDSYWNETNFGQLVLDMDNAGRIDLREVRTELYIGSEQSYCKILILEVL
ncbi:Methyltransferase domain-containing protein [Cohaesibacter sp. ES.047]|uniref:class I SAM-dependent DNA methyltransferase n=1 Tax=Cohaesibacter sp. ES.047 TaxID=1798205 RepID=UPI000BC0D796|nr:class I SAM-dependent methyltransferase [Cohaesibacter sp. ES.047]SNY92550.1 Methyltransferase domain-containing protein [Cohaesibacter sp. ES.047]